jgi:hypothetical protein
VRGLDHGSWRRAYNAICIPTLTYGAPVWFRGQKRHIRTLQVVQNSAIVVIMGAFQSAPREPLHQLSAILPIQLRIEKLAKQAAIRLLTLPTSSPVLQRLGNPWCSAQGSGIPLPYSPLAHPPVSCVRRLIKRVPADSRRPPDFNHPPWRRCQPPPARFTVSQLVCKGDERKKLISSIVNTHYDKSDKVLIYCRALSPNPTRTHPMWTAACVAFRRGQEVGHRVTVLGQNASARDAAFHAVADAADLTRDLLADSPSPSVSILTADHIVLPYCQVTDRHDNAEACKAICDTISDLLATHPASTCAIRWLPGTASFLPLERLQNIATDEAAHTAPDLLITAPTIDIAETSGKMFDKGNPGHFGIIV